MLSTIIRHAAIPSGYLILTSIWSANGKENTCYLQRYTPSILTRAMVLDHSETYTNETVATAAFFAMDQQENTK